MFEFLSGLGYEIQARYNTVLRDIKSKSSSFYDAYLDLQEASIKSIIDAHGIEYDESRTCGYLLRDERIRGLFVNTLGVPKDSYDKIQDRTAKVNRHKHHKEKHIVADSVVLFMEDFHRFMKACCGSNEEFNGEYFRGIFGEYERANAALTQEKEAIISELEDLVREKRMTEEQLKTYQDALALSKVSEEGLAEENDALLREISALKSLKLSILDQKLSKTIDMLNDLQHYVLESRAIGIAVGKTIIGQDITETDYMRDAMESVKKRDSVFNMLHQQGEDIESLSSKFSDMDIDSLYEAAKQHWDSKNYKVAEGFYEHICLLRPLDWKAPFYAGLCKIKGNCSVNDFVYNVFPRSQQTFYAAINQIQRLENEQAKFDAFGEVLGIAVELCDKDVKNYVEHIRKPNEESKHSLFKEEASFIYAVQAFIASLLRELEQFKQMPCFEDLASKLSKVFESSIKEEPKHRCDRTISREEYDRFLKYGGGSEGLAYIPRSDS